MTIIACHVRGIFRGNTSMKASVYYENGGPDVFRYEDVPDAECEVNGIVIRVVGQFQTVPDWPVRLR